MTWMHLVFTAMICVPLTLFIGNSFKFLLHILYYRICKEAVYDLLDRNEDLIMREILAKIKVTNS